MTRRWHLAEVAPPGTTRTWELALVEADAQAPAVPAIHETGVDVAPAGEAFDVISTRTTGDEEGSALVFVHAVTAFDTPERERAFNAWYDDVHVPEYLAADGVLRNWRLRSVGRPQAYLAVYEVRTIEHFDRAVQDRADAGQQAFDGIWLPFLRYAGSTHQIRRRGPLGGAP